MTENSVTYNCKVYIVDEIMGRGKSIAAINYINTHDDEKFLYITPYINEIEQRIIPLCKNKNFVTPEEKKAGTKTRHIKTLLNKGYNIASTHALFMRFDEEIIDICRNQNYTLIMDEVSDVVTEYKMTQQDRDTLFEKYVEVDEKTKLLKWREDQINYSGKFAEEKRLCDLGCLGKYGDDIMMWMFPIQAFNAFNKVFILTYMFNAQIQRYYYDFFKLPYTYIYVNGNSPETYEFSTVEEQMSLKHDYSKLIHIYESDALNAIGSMETDLSKTWYYRNAQNKNIVITKLKNNLFNYFHNIMKSPTGNNLWTTFKDYRKYISGNGYAKGYIPSNLRATNNYRDRNTIAYPINKYLHVYIKNFFIGHGITVDEDGYALSEMLQWIWRSAIRDGNPIWIYIPSKRMRTLLQNWIIEVSGSGRQ